MITTNVPVDCVAFMLIRNRHILVEAWDGEIGVHEAESLHWLPLANLSSLDLDVDVTAVQQYLTQPHLPTN